MVENDNNSMLTDSGKSDEEDFEGYRSFSLEMENGSYLKGMERIHVNDNGDSDQYLFLLTESPVEELQPVLEEDPNVVDYYEKNGQIEANFDRKDEVPYNILIKESINVEEIEDRNFIGFWGDLQENVESIDQYLQEMEPGDTSRKGLEEIVDRLDEQKSGEAINGP